MVYSSTVKMATGGRDGSNAFRSMGRARALLQAIEDFRMREERGRIMRIQRGRAGAPGVIRSIVEGWLGRETMCSQQG